MKLPSNIDSATLRRLSVETSSDPRTVVKVLEGLPVRGLAKHRILAVLEREGLLPSAPQPSDAVE